MKAWKFFAVFTFVTGGLFAQSQTYTFKVLVSKGKTELKSSDAWQNIKVGASLKASDEVKISENSYLGLIHVNGKPLEIKQAGSYKVADLASKVSGAGSSVMTKYTDFILSSEQDKKNRLSATGAVHRGLLKDVIIVFLSPTEHANLYGDKIALQWVGDVKGPYEVVFTSFLDDKLAKFETSENQLVVDLNEGKFKTEPNIMMKVVSKSNPGQGSKDYVIKKMGSVEREKYTKMITEIKGSLDEGSAFGKYLMAGFYEENMLLNDALTAYQEAIKLAPDVPLYKEAYDTFLVRLGFELK